MANPYTDTRAIAARLAQVRPMGTTASGGLNPTGPAPSEAAIKLGRAANKYAIQNPELRAQIEAIANQGKAQSSVVGRVLGNPVTKAVLKGAEVFALPGRAVVSTAREVVDALDSDPNTHASLKDFGKHMTDSTYGFGKAFPGHTGNKWLDRAIGFVGDVALDPITYMTFGAGKFAGYGGRLKLAEEVLATTGDNALAATVARVGRTALKDSPDILERVGANKFGVYMFGKRLKVGALGEGLKIPLSGTIGEIGESALAKIRLGATETRLGKYLQRITMPIEGLSQRILLAQGKLAPEVAADFIREINVRPIQRAAQAKAAQEFEQELMAILQSEGSSIDAYRNTIHKYLTNPDLLVNATDDERRAVQVWRTYLDGKWEDISGRWKAIDPAFEGIGRQENYFPLVASDDATKWMYSDAEKAASIRGIYQSDPFGIPDSFQPRNLREGSDFFGYILKKEDLVPERLNEIARVHGGLDFNFFETDIVPVMRKYAHDAAQEVGLTARTQHLVDKGFFQRIKEMKVDVHQVDEEAVAAARAAVDESKNLLTAAERDFTQAVGDLANTVRTEAQKVSVGVRTGQSLVDDIQRFLIDLPEQVGRQQQLIDAARERLIRMFGPIGEISQHALSEDFPATLRPLLKEFDNMTAELEKYSGVVRDLWEQASSETFNVSMAEGIARDIEDAAKAASDKMKALQDSFQSSVEAANALEAVWDNLVYGKRLPSDSAQSKLFEDIRDLLAVKKTEKAKKAAEKRASALGVRGRLRDFLSGNAASRSIPEMDGPVKFFDEVFNGISGSGTAQLSRTRIARMSDAEFERIILNSNAVDVSVRDLREAAAYAIGRDIRLYRASSIDDLPEFVRIRHQKLIEMLKDAGDAEAARVARETANKKYWTAIEALDARWGSAYEEAINIQQTVKELGALVDFIGNDFAKAYGQDWASLEFTPDMLAGIKMGLDLKLGIGAAESAAADIRLGNAAWLQDYLPDETMKVFGKNIANPEYRKYTLGEVVSSLQSRAETSRIMFEEDSINVENVLSANLLRGKEVSDTVTTTRKQLVKDYESKATQVSKAPRLSRRAQSLASNADVVRQNLAHTLVQYDAVSDAVSKFESISAVMAQHGLVPTEDMWSGILRTVSTKYGDQFTEKLNNVYLAEDAMKKFRSEFFDAMEQMKRLPKEQQKHVSVVFSDVLNNMLASPDGGSVLRDVIGSSLRGGIDPVDMREEVRTLESAVRSASASGDKEALQSAKNRLDEYVRQHVIPWAKEKKPEIRADKKPALDLLKSTFKDEGGAIRTISKKRAAMLRTPLSKNATERDVHRWFESFFDKLDTAGVVGSDTAQVVGRGTFTKMRDSYMESRLFFAQMRDGYIDVNAFFNTMNGVADSPSGYGVMMTELAKKLDGVTQLAEENPIVRGAQMGAVGGDWVEAYKKGPRIAAKAETEAATAEAKAARAKVINDAFNNPALTDEQLKELGFTKAMRDAHAKVVEHQKQMASIEYARALQDQEMVSFLQSVAGVDFSKFEDGIIVGHEFKDIYQGDVINATQSIDNEVKSVAQQRDELLAMKERSRRRVVEPFVTEHNGKIVFKSNQDKNIAMERLRVWDINEGKQFDFKISQLDNRSESLVADAQRSTKGVNVPVGTERIPVFAKMPDGSNLVFTKAEWDSLFIPPYTRGDLGAVGSELRSAIGERKALQARIEKARSVPSATWDTAKRRYIVELEKRIANLDSAINELQTSIERNMIVTRNSALEKLRILVHGENKINPREWENAYQQLNGVMRNDVISWSYDGTIRNAQPVNATLAHYMKPAFDKQFESYRAMYPVVVPPEYASLADALRAGWKVPPRPSMSDVYPIIRPDLMHEYPIQSLRSGLNGMWRDNPSSKVLERAQTLAAEIAAGPVADAETTLKRLQNAANSARSAANTARTAADDVQLSFKKAITQLREYEIKAARAAGADFNLPGADMFPYTAETFPYNRVEYTLNGKTYSIPSLSEMLQNPERAINMAKKRGELFFDLKKPGNVAIWSQSPEEVKNVIALHAVQSLLLQDSAETIRATVRNATEQRLKEIDSTVANFWKAGGDGPDGGLKHLSDTVASIRAAINLERTRVGAEVADEIAKTSEEMLKTKLDIFELGAELRASLGGFDPERINLDDLNSVVSALHKRGVMMDEIVKNMPNSKATRSLLGSSNPKTIEKWRQIHLDWIEGNRAVLRELAKADLADGGTAKLWEAFIGAYAAEGRFITKQGQVNTAKQALEAAQAGTYVEKVLMPATKEFEEAAKSMLDAEGRTIATQFNLPSYSVNAQVQQIMNNVSKINDAQTMRQLGRFLGSYTGFFKAYATLTPGFHVRNAISNTFQLFAAGAEVGNMRQGLKLWRSMGEHIASGGTVESWLASGVVPEALVPRARIAAETTLALGGGKTDEAFQEFLKLGKNVITDNKATQASRAFGHRVEGSARFMLAFDSAMKDMDFVESFNRTKRFLFDYSDPTILDETVRNVIPFWTWMSRNLPVQIVTQWTNPKPYVIYKHLADNFAVSDRETVPQYLKDKGLQMSAGVILQPDLPMNAAQDVFSQLETPRKALSMLNPGLRVPMELAGGRQFFTGQQMNTPEEMLKYGVTSMLPMLGQAERLGRSGGTADEYALARYLGVPIRGINQQTRDNELKRRLYELQNMMNNKGQ